MTKKDDAEYAREAVKLLCKYLSHDQRKLMDGTKLFAFWGEHRSELPTYTGLGDDWQFFHSACSKYIGPTARLF